MDVVLGAVVWLRVFLLARASVATEILALRQQLAVLQRQSKRPVWSKNSAGVEVLVSCQVVMHNGLNSQPTVWTEQCRCRSQDEARVTFRSLQVALSMSDSTRPPSIQNHRATRHHGSSNAASRPVAHGNALAHYTAPVRRPAR